MTDNHQDRLHQVALFRFGVIADLVQQRRGTKGLYDLIQQKAEETFDIPGSMRTRIAAETIRDWLKAYRKGGFDALMPKASGRPRAAAGPAAGGG